MLAGRRCPDFDRRRRHAQDGQQVQAVSGPVAGRLEPRIPIVHLPKTIDNDYTGIDFTFGYFTAVETLASEIRNLLADAEASAHLLSDRDHGPQRRLAGLRRGHRRRGQPGDQRRGHSPASTRHAKKSIDPKTGEKKTRTIMNVDEVVKRIVHDARPRGEGRQGIRRDRAWPKGWPSILPIELSARISPRRARAHRHRAGESVPAFADYVAEEYKQQTGTTRRITGLQLGYEARCAQPHAFDVMLGSQLGVGAYRALVERTLNGVMVSVAGQLEAELRAVRAAGRSGNAGHDGPLHRPRLRFPPPGAVSGNVRERVSRALSAVETLDVRSARSACPWCSARRSSADRARRPSAAPGPWP